MPYAPRRALGEQRWGSRGILPAVRQLTLVFGRSGEVTRLLCVALIPLGTACGGQASGTDDRAPTRGSASAGGTQQTEAHSSGAGGRTTEGPSTGTAPVGAAAAPSTPPDELDGGGGAPSAPDLPDKPPVESDPTGYPYSTAAVPGEECVYGWAEVLRVVVPIPPEGTPAVLAQDCAAASNEPLSSAWAARASLQLDAADPLRATGVITIAPELADRVIGLPEVTVIEAAPAGDSPTLGPVSSDRGTFTFSAAWSAQPRALDPPSLVLEIRFTLDCGVTTREIVASTTLYYCSDGGPDGISGWASSGDRCLVCANICEMAASPILPSGAEDDMALSAALELRIRVLREVHGALILLAEHAAGVGDFDYRWTVSGGQLHWVDGDIAVWTPPSASACVGLPLVQVAVAARTMVGAASLRWSRAA